MSDNASRNLTLDAAVADVEARYAAANPHSRARFEATLDAMPGANTRSVLHYDPFPVGIARGEGARLTDLDGHVYRDFLGEYTAGLYGHSEPVIMAAIREALADGIVLGGPNRWEGKLAELMCDRFPAVESIRFCNSGSEANLMCLSLARAYTGRDLVMAFNGGYHGGLLTFRGGPSRINAPYPSVVCRYNDPEAAAAMIAEHAGQLAAVIVEPVMGGGGAIAGTHEFLSTLRAETAKHGVLLVFDEVMTSRLAPGGMHDKLGITPDLIAFGKYLGGGVTFGAFGGRRDIMHMLDPRNPKGLPHSGTYNNNVLTMAAGAAGLSQVFTPAACRRLNESGDRLRERLQATADARSAPVKVTGVGSMLAIHFQRSDIVRAEDADATPMQARKLLHLDLNLRGFYLARRGFMALMLPLTEEDHDALVAAFGDFLDEHDKVLEAAAA